MSKQVNPFLKNIQQASPLSSVSPLCRKPIVKKKKGGSGKLIVFVLILLAGGGLYYKMQLDKKAEISASQLADAKAKEAARLAAEKAALAAKAEKERLARLAAEQAERDRQAKLLADAANNSTVADAVKDEPIEPVVVPDVVIAVEEENVPEELKGTPVLMSVDALKTENVQQWAKAQDAAFTKKAWSAYHEYIIRGLKENFKKLISWSGFDLPKFKENPKMLEAMNLHRFLSLVSPAWLEEKSGSPFLKYVVTNENGALEALLSCLTGRESISEMERVLVTWERMWMNSSDKLRKKYQSLAIATAIMRPEAATGCRLRTANASSSSYQEASKPMDIDKVYLNLVSYAEEGRLRGKLDRMTPTQLTYVVNVCLPQSEMAWVQKEPKLRPLTWDTWGSAYGLIRYRMDRAAGKVDPYTDYSFEDILEQGGICMDQAYFGVNTARCMGIPAAYVTGSGKNGGHAWMIYLNSKGDWVEAGGIGYTSGTTPSPQTGEMLHQSLFTMESDRRSGGSRLIDARLLLAIGSTLVSLEEYTVAKDLYLAARKAAPTHPMPWRASIDFLGLEEVGTKFEEWQGLVTDIRRRFKDRPDFLVLAEEVEDKYVFPNQGVAETEKNLLRQRNQLERATDDGRVDLITKSLQRQVDNLVEHKQLDEADKVYKGALREYSEQTDAYPVVMGQYYRFAMANEAYKEKAVESMWNHYKARVETKDQGLFRVKLEVSIAKQIAGYFRELGNEKKALSIERIADERLQRVTRVIREEPNRPTRKKKPTRAEREKGSEAYTSSESA